MPRSWKRTSPYTLRWRRSVYQNKSPEIPVGDQGGIKPGDVVLAILMPSLTRPLLMQTLPVCVGRRGQAGEHIRVPPIWLECTEIGEEADVVLIPYIMGADHDIKEVTE